MSQDDKVNWGALAIIAIWFTFFATCWLVGIYVVVRVVRLAWFN